jgi:hypothetical protein
MSSSRETPWISGLKKEQIGVTDDSTIAGKAGTYPPFSALVYSSGV